MYTFVWLCVSFDYLGRDVSASVLCDFKQISNSCFSWHFSPLAALLFFAFIYMCVLLTSFFLSFLESVRGMQVVLTTQSDSHESFKPKMVARGRAMGETHSPLLFSFSMYTCRHCWWSAPFMFARWGQGQHVNPNRFKSTFVNREGGGEDACRVILRVENSGWDPNKEAIRYYLKLRERDPKTLKHA